MGNFQELHRDSISNLFRHSSGYEDNTDLINHNIQKFKTEQLAEFSRICSNMEKSFFEKNDYFIKPIQFYLCSSSQMRRYIYRKGL